MSDTQADSSSTIERTRPSHEEVLAERARRKANRRALRKRSEPLPVAAMMSLCGVPSAKLDPYSDPPGTIHARPMSCGQFSELILHPGVVVPDPRIPRGYLVLPEPILNELGLENGGSMDYIDSNGRVVFLRVRLGDHDDAVSAHPETCRGISDQRIVLRAPTSRGCGLELHGVRS